MHGQLIRFQRRNAQNWSRRARAAGADESHQADVARRIRMLQARAAGKLELATLPARRPAPLIPLDGKFRTRDMPFADMVFVVCAVCALIWWSIVGL